MYNMISANNQNFEWLSEAVVLRLLTKASQQFRDQTYDINKIARQTIFFLQFQCTEDANYNKPSDHVSKQILNFCSLLGQAPQYFIQLLNEEIITSHSHIITLNSRNELVAKRFFGDFTKWCEKEENMPKYRSNEKLEKEMYAFINVVAKKICKIYDQCCRMLKKDVEALTEKIRKSKIMNNYMLYKIFREISEYAKKVVEEKCTETVFRNCPADVIHQFFHYIINKFEVIKLFANQEISHSMFEPSPLVFFGNFEKNDNIELIPKQAVSIEGKFAIFVKTFSEDSELQRTLQDYLLILDSEMNLRVINCKTLRKKWFIMNDIKTKTRLTVMAKQYILNGQSQIDALLKAKPEPITSLINCQPLESFTNFNGVIGRCLYLMKRYTGVSDFFKDISKRAILTRSMEQLMHQIPIVGYMIFAGTFSANFYKIFSNKFSTDKKKLKEFGGFMLNTTTTVGSSIIGALTGQMLIPIPVVGALIGSVIGGFIGDKGGKQINSWIEKKKFYQTITYLQKSQIDQSYWFCTEQFYKILEIKEEQFHLYIPSYMQDFVFATLIAFVLVCFYESKRLNTYNLQKSKKISEKDSSGYGKKRQKQFQEEVHKLNMEEVFQTEFNILKIVEFLQANNASLYQHYDTLEKSIVNNLSKIIN